MVAAESRSNEVIWEDRPVDARFVTADELERITQICAAHGIAIIADEVFADYELEADAAAVAGHAVTSTRGLAFALGGLSKSIAFVCNRIRLTALRQHMPTRGPKALLQSPIATRKKGPRRGPVRIAELRAPR